MLYVRHIVAVSIILSVDVLEGCMFRGAERDVCAEIERLVQMAQVQHS